MCTTVAKTGDKLIFGRNMDIDESFGEELILIPRKYTLKYKMAKQSENHFAVMGIGTVIDGYPLLAEGMNEFGLCMAGLNFVGNARYWSPEEGRDNLAPYELIPWILSSCKSLKDAIAKLKKVNLISLPFKKDIPLPTLHFHIADKQGSIVYESVKEGEKIYKNPVGVVTNNPPFDIQLTLLSNYGGLSPRASSTALKPYSLGLGSYGLPGDFSSGSRFARAVFAKNNTLWQAGREIYGMMRILDLVSVPCGCVLNGEEKPHYTLYQSVMDGGECVYYFRSCGSLDFSRVEMMGMDTEGDTLTELDIK